MLRGLRRKQVVWQQKPVITATTETFAPKIDEKCCNHNNDDEDGDNDYDNDEDGDDNDEDGDDNDEDGDDNDEDDYDHDNDNCHRRHKPHPEPQSAQPCIDCKRFVIINKQAGTYTINGSIGNGSGTTYCLRNNITHNLSLGPAIRIINATGVTLKLGGNSITGTNAGTFTPVAGVASPGNGPALIQVENSSEVVITSDSINSAIIGILVQNSIKVTIDNVRVTGNVHGIVIRNSRDVTLKNSETDGTRASLWVIDSDIKAINNKFSPVPSGGPYVIAGVLVHNTPQVQLPVASARPAIQTGKLSTQNLITIKNVPNKYQIGRRRFTKQKVSKIVPAAILNKKQIGVTAIKSSPNINRVTEKTQNTNLIKDNTANINQTVEKTINPAQVLVGGTQVSFLQNYFTNNDLFVAAATNVAIEDNQHLQEGDPDFPFGQVQFGQGPGIVLEPEVEGDPEEIYPFGEVNSAKLSGNYFHARNNNVQTKNVIINQASAVDVVDNVLLNNAFGDPEVGETEASSILIGTEASSGEPSVNGVSVRKNTISGILGPRTIPGPTPYGILVRSPDPRSCDNLRVRNITIKDNHISDKVIGILIDNVRATVIKQNDLEGISGVGIRVVASGAIVRDNNILGLNGQIGIEVGDVGNLLCSQVLVAGNQVSGFFTPYLPRQATPSLDNFQEAPYFNIAF